MKIFLQKSWPILFLAGVFLTLFYKVIFFGQVFIEGDNFHLNIPAKYFLVQQISHGQFPLWNPYLFTGIPYFADFNLGTLNPSNILYFLFPVPRALTVLTVIDFFVLGIGMYILLRFLKLSKIASLIGGVLMSLGGMPFVLLGNMTFMQVIVYIPFLFLLTLKFCREKTVKWLLLLIGVQFLQFIAGHPQETYYTMFFISCYLFFLSPFHLVKKVLLILSFLLFPTLLASVQLFPFIEYVLHANRSTGLGYAGWGGLTIPMLATFLFPTFYGSHIDGTWWGPQAVLAGFIGIPSLFLVYISIRFNSFKETWFYFLGMFLSFFLAFGILAPFFYLFYYLVPGWRLFRSPAGILVFFTFFATLLTAYGAEYLKNNSEKFKNLGKLITVIGLLFTICSVAVYVYAGKSGFWKQVFVFLQNHLHSHMFSAVLFYNTIKIQQMLQGIMWNIVFVSIALLLTGIILWQFYKKTYQLFLLLLLIVGEFLVVNPRVLLLAPLHYYDTGKNIPAVLKPVQSGQYRLLSVPVDFHQNRKYLPPSDFFYREGQTNLTIYQYDNNMERGLYQAGGYVSLVPDSFALFIGAKDAATNVTNINFSQATQQQLSLSSVRYILSYEPIKNYNDIPLQLVSAQKNQYIYENTDALPRVYILENKNDTGIEWNKDSPTDISLSVSSPRQSHLILTDWYYPGWRALVNGREAPISSYLSTFREIVLPKGESHVEFQYDPLSLKAGLGVSVLCIIIWLVLMLSKRKVKLDR